MEDVRIQLLIGGKDLVYEMYQILKVQFEEQKKGTAKNKVDTMEFCETFNVPETVISNELIKMLVTGATYYQKHNNQMVVNEDDAFFDGLKDKVLKVLEEKVEAGLSLVDKKEMFDVFSNICTSFDACRYDVFKEVMERITNDVKCVGIINSNTPLKFKALITAIEVLDEIISMAQGRIEKEQQKTVEEQMQEIDNLIANQLTEKFGADSNVIKEVKARFDELKNSYEQKINLN